MVATWLWHYLHVLIYYEAKMCIRYSFACSFQNGDPVVPVFLQADKKDVVGLQEQVIMSVFDY